jgi:hypothetical protein
MLASINPLGERGRNQRYAVTVTSYVVASFSAGALLGASLGALGSVMPFSAPQLAIVVALLATLGLLLDRRLFGLRVPGPHRQVNEDWLSTYRGWVYGAAFGAQLGLAFTTIVATSATWLAFICAFASGSPIAGLIIGATFGLIRALPLFLTANAYEPATLNVRLRRVDQARPHVALVVGMLQAGLALVLLAAVIG